MTPDDLDLCGCCGQLADADELDLHGGLCPACTEIVNEGDGDE